ncbi:MAG TPA: NDP-sugar synthase [Candidatus Acidoferrales bacterium]|nr:NDP-sugar synthase [Candidatus Acidoferrales bacterium]
MQAVVLVGGEGTRLRPLTYGTPKPMVPIFGVPFLERTLSRLYEAGIDHAILAAGYLPEAITKHLGDGSRLGMRLTYVIEESPLGTAGALRNVANHITGPFFVLNGDIMTSLDLGAMIRFHREKGGLGALHLIRVEDPSAFGCVPHDENGRIRSFVEKPPRETAPTNEVNAGTYLLEREVLDAIPPGRMVSIERETFPQLLASGAALYAYTTGDYWIDIGRPEHYEKIHRDVLDRRLTLGPLADATAHRGEFYLSGSFPPAGVLAPSYLGEGVTLDEGATAGPHTVLGDRVSVGPRAVVSDSILWDGVIVEEGAIVRGAIVASGARIGRGAAVEPGTVIGHDAVIPPNAVVPRDARITAEVPVS